jgi:oxaloacetate decarboxylase (Na+ extruding) subunit gamma
MSENLEIALELLGIGMITVFIILFLVVGIGSTIIRVVNRFMPEAEKTLIAKVATTSSVDSRKVSAIVAAVQSVTQGKGKVIKIEKV